MSGGMYQMDGGRVVGGGGIIKSTKVPSAAPSSIPSLTGTAAVTTNVAKLYSSNGSAQHAAAAKHAAVVAHLTAQQAAVKAQRTAAASSSSTPRNGGQGGSGAIPRGSIGPRHQGAPYPRPQSAMLPHSEKIPPATMATGSTTISTLSGVQPTAETSGLSAGSSKNPFICILCNNPFQNPCLLACYHTFCAACLRARISKEGKLVCPLCGKITQLRDGHSLPPSDNLIRFIMESTCEEFPSCANCDRNEKSPMFFCNTCVCWSSQKKCEHLCTLINKETGLVLGDSSNLPMFYCNTCGQPLCATCRDETHRAKMFSQHEVIDMPSKKLKESSKMCQLHGEVFTMFCTRKKTLLCMKCFRETSADAKSHCMDLETAYNVGGKRLERAITSMNEVQNSLRDGVILFRALLDELRRTWECEREGINSIYTTLNETIKKQYDILLDDLESQYNTRGSHLRSQLSSVITMLPTVQMHLILCTFFTSTADKHEFIVMAYQLIDRLAALNHLSYPLRSDLPSNQSVDISTNYKESFAQCLEPFTASLLPQSSVSSTNGVRTTNQQTSNTSSLVEALSSSSSKGGGGPVSSGGSHKRSTSSGAQHYFQSNSQRTGSDVNYSTYPGRAATSLAQAAGLTVTAPDSTSFVASGGATLSRVHWSRQGPTPAESIKRQTLSARGLSDKEFTKHCRGFDGQIKGLNNHFNSIKNQVASLHRDVIRVPPQRDGDTRAAAPQPILEYRRIEDIVIQCTSLTNELEKTDQLMRDRKDLFHKMWEEEQQRIMTEQSIFKEQVSELNNLRYDLRQLMEIAQQLEPYVRTSEMEHPRSTEMSAADLLSSSRGHATNQQIGNAATTFSHTPTKQESRKHQSETMEFSSGSQFSSSAPVPSIEGSSQLELGEHYKKRLDNIAVLAAIQAIQASSQQHRSYIGAEMPIPPPPLNTAPRFSELEQKKYYPRGQSTTNGSILQQAQHVRTSSGGILIKRSAAGPSVNFQEKENTDHSSASNQLSALGPYSSSYNSRYEYGAEEMFPVRDVPSSSGVNNGSSFCPVPPPPPMATLTSMPSIVPPPGKLPTIYPPPPPSSSSTSGGGDQPSMSAEFPLAEPPFEYSTQAVAASKHDINMFSWNKPKSHSEGTAAAPEVKRGLLSSILEKVRSKDSESPSVGGTTSSSSNISNKTPSGTAATLLSTNQPKTLNMSGLAPLASSESLATTTASVGSVGSTTSVIHKPFEPPGLGKPSRVTPVGLDEADDNDFLSAGDHISATESMSINQDTSSVEVLSVIRFNKSVSSTVGGGGSSLGGRMERATSKISSTSNLSSEKAFSSSSETAATSNPSSAPVHSLVRQRSAEDVLQDDIPLFNPCPACDANAATHRHQGRNSTAISNNANLRRRARSEGRRSRESRSNQKIRSHDQYSSNHMSKSARSDKLFDSEDEADISTSGQTCSTLQRRLSAPEIEENTLSAISNTGGTFGTTDITSSEDAASSIISAKFGNHSILPRVPIPDGSNRSYSSKQSGGRPIAIHPYGPSYYTTFSNLEYQRQRKSRSSPPSDNHSQSSPKVGEMSTQKRPSYSSNGNIKRQNIQSTSGQEEYHTSSDSEVGSGSRPGSREARSRSPRYSLGSIDSQDLQKAVAHIQETLKLRMEKRENIEQQKEGQGSGYQKQQHKSEVVAVVHRSGESPSKEYKERQRENRTASPAGSTSSKKSATMEELGPYDTIKPSRMRKGMLGAKNKNGNGLAKRNNNNNVNTNRNSVGENTQQEKKSFDLSDKVVIRVQPPSVPPKPESLRPLNPVESTTNPRKSTLEKADSFEGHEEAVRTLVEAVNESRKFEASIAAQQKTYPGRTNLDSSSDKGGNHEQSNPS